MEYLVKTLPVLYDEIVSKFSASDQDRFDKLVKQIEDNPYLGDILQIKSIREKRFNGKRIYFLIFEDLKAVLIVAISNKKNQQKIIDFIKENQNEYRELVKKILDEQD